MKQVRIWILNLNPSPDLAQTLHRILESSQSCFQSSIERIELFHTESVAYELSNDISQLVDLILLVLPQTASESLGDLPGSLKLTAPMIVILEHSEPSELLKLLQFGATDFIMAPLTAPEVVARISRVLEQNQIKRTIAQSIRSKIGLQQIIGENPVFLKEISKISLLAQCDTSVLIAGETGTGKELVARAIHYLGNRASLPFIPVNCGAIPTDLIENELFGHERGAFTGAFGKQDGLIQEAGGGTLFLDEVDSLSLMAQIKLLRFIQHKEYRRLGTAKLLRADVRIISASNADLEQAVATGKFRQDLYYRLNVVPINLPPLRERPDDIAILAKHFLSQCSSKFKKVFTGFSPKALEKLLFYDWPGNIRELEHVIERAVLLCGVEVIQSDHIILSPNWDTVYRGSFNEMKARVVARFERDYIQSLLIAHNGNITRAAEAASKERRTFWELIRKHKIDVQKFKFDQQ